MLHQNPFKNRKVGRPISSDNHWNFQWEWVTDAWLPRQICFFQGNWSKFLISFWLNLQPTASRQATTCLKSPHFTCVLGLVLIPHRKCPGNPRETHAKSERVAPRAAMARHLRSERDANSGISVKHRTNQLSRDNFACRVWCKPALPASARWEQEPALLCMRGRLYLVLVRAGWEILCAGNWVLVEPKHVNLISSKIAKHVDIQY